MKKKKKKNVNGLQKALKQKKKSWRGVKIFIINTTALSKIIYEKM